MPDLAYKDINFVWVSDHYDFHREGLCLYEGKLARFTCVEDYPDGWGSCGEDCDGCSLCDDYPIACQVWPLTPFQRFSWMRQKKAFEIMVGYHWSYPYRRQGERFRYRKPKWASRLLMHLYYLPLRWRRRRAAARRS